MQEDITFRDLKKVWWKLYIFCFQTWNLRSNENQQVILDLKETLLEKPYETMNPPRISIFAFAQAKRGEVQLPHLDEYL